MRETIAEELILKYVKGLCTQEEKTLVEAGFLMDFKSGIRHIPEAEIEAACNRIQKSVKLYVASHPKKPAQPFKLWPLIAGAASVIIVFAVGLFFYSVGLKPETASIITYANDIAPGKDGATLTLANGKKIVLSDVMNGKLAEEAGVKIEKTADGQLLYTVEGNANNGKYNTLSTAKGEQYQVRLPDGTKVWLNAASSITYSTNFKGHVIRKVKLYGEAYFEVYKDKLRPFVVEGKDQEVQVYGTHFNINSYKDEGSIKTTLLEGSVAVRIPSAGAMEDTMLRPGQEAVLTGSKLIVNTVNTRQAVAWKNNQFIFENDDIQYIMRMLERWYDIEVVYQGGLSDERFGGFISRSDQLSEVLKSLQLTGKVRFNIQGRRVFVIK